MQIAKHKVVSIDYELTDDKGDVIDTSEGSEPLTYLHGTGNIIPGLENALEGKVSGEQINVSIQPADAYGHQRDELRQVVPRDEFKGIDDLQVGMRFRVPTESGEPLVVTVVEIEQDSVTVDGNHELAGVTLHFEVTIRDVRESTPEEISHGHAHGPDGHADH